LLAARAGADVTGLDFAPRLIETARRRARDQGLSVRFDVGDAEALPCAASSFDAISSAMGAIFAPDHEAVAAELARVASPGGRIAISAWREGGGWTPVTRRYWEPDQPGSRDSRDWGREDYVEAVLGKAFGLRFEEGDAPVTGAAGEEVWQLVTTASGPFKAFVASLEPERAERLHQEFVEFLDQHQRDGRVNLPSPYLMIVGTRRG
jgi:SAM-dependent methyltransferase